MSSIGVTKYNEIPWRYTLYFLGRISVFTVEVHDIIIMANVTIPVKQYATRIMCTVYICKIILVYLATDFLSGGHIQIFRIEV